MAWKHAMDCMVSYCYCHESLTVMTSLTSLLRGPLRNGVTVIGSLTIMRSLTSPLTVMRTTSRPVLEAQGEPVCHAHTCSTVMHRHVSLAPPQTSLSTLLHTCSTAMHRHGSLAPVLLAGACGLSDTAHTRTLLSAAPDTASRAPRASLATAQVGSSTREGCTEGLEVMHGSGKGSWLGWRGIFCCAWHACWHAALPMHMLSAWCHRAHYLVLHIDAGGHVIMATCVGPCCPHRPLLTCCGHPVSTVHIASVADHG